MKVEELLNRKAIRYKRSGQDYVVKCLNPEHEDHNPSMRIDIVLGIFKCVSCGFSGNIFKFFNEQSNPIDIKKELIRRKVDNIRGSSIGLEMPKDITPFIAPYRGIKGETYIKFKAFKTSEIGMENRLVFPIFSSDGRIVVFQGRDLFNTERSKYLNYPRGVRLPLYPEATPINGKVLLVEGIFDMLNLHDKGLTNAICAFGLETVKNEDLENLKLRDVVGIDVVFDGDDAGRKAAPKMRERLSELGFYVRVINLKDNKDPGDMSQEEVTLLKRKLYD